MARRAFQRMHGGALIVTLYPQEAELLLMTARDMMTIVEEPPDGDVRDRLYPRAYLDPTEEKAQGEYDALVHDDLVAARRAAFEVIVEGLDGVPTDDRGLVEIVLAPEHEMQWLSAMNDARLVVGTALGVTEDLETEFEPDDPRFEYGVLYGWLGELQDELLTVLLDEIGDGGSDDDIDGPSDEPSGGPGAPS